MESKGILLKERREDNFKISKKKIIVDIKYLNIQNISWIIKKEGIK